MRSRFLPVGITMALVACSEAPLGIASRTDLVDAEAIHFWESSAAVYWNGVARDLVVTNRSPAPFAIRGYAIVSVAQYNAAIAAEKGRAGKVHPSVRAAIGGASVAALSYLYPTHASALETMLADFLAAPAWAGENHTDDLAGENIGRSIAAQVVTRAQADNFFAPGTVTIPIGPGIWFSSSPPVGALWGQARTYFLEAGNQLRPPAPPAFGSQPFLDALAEVRQISDTRTPAQDASAKFWDFPAGTYTPPGYWNEQATELAVKYHLTQRAAAHLFALINMVAFDAIVASHEAKYFYLLPRPSQADPGITLSMPLPNFPSYPSNHAAISAGMARVLGHVFPNERARLDALADDAAVSRVLGGIHYRFDGEAGLALGRALAALAIANDVVGHEPFVLR